MEAAKQQDAVKCAKCGRQTPKGEDACGYCGAHLYIECPHCDHRNERRRRACDKCGRRLRAGMLKRMKRWMLGRSRKHTIILTGLMILLVVVLCWGAFALAEVEIFKFR